MTGAILHDIGKLDELCYERAIHYTDEGQLLGHIIMGLEQVTERMNAIEGFPPAYKTLIKHLLISHHGEYEFGSPKLPMFREALVLHYLDDLDSKMGAARAVLGAVGGEAGWTAFSPALNRRLLAPRSVSRGARSGCCGASGEGPETRRGSGSQNEALQLREAMGTSTPAVRGIRRSILELAPLELDCMNVLWRLGQATVRDVHGAMAITRPRAYTTIMTILDRLAQKGVVGRKKAGRAWLYTAQSLRRAGADSCRGAVGGRILSRLDGRVGLACNESKPHSSGDFEPGKHRTKAKNDGLMGSGPV